MKRESMASRILAALARADVPLLADQVAEAIGENTSVVSAELSKLYQQTRVNRSGERGNKQNGTRRLWSLPEQPAQTRSNVIPLHPAPPAPKFMLPVIRRHDCVNEPDCTKWAVSQSFAAVRDRAHPWHGIEGMTCPTPCPGYQQVPKRVAPHPSNWMGGEG